MSNSPTQPTRTLIDRDPFAISRTARWSFAWGCEVFNTIFELGGEEFLAGIDWSGSILYAFPTAPSGIPGQTGPIWASL